jgi:EAL domain-containing protein (putative c-di-GMP-specific phosphodiesterase class I)
LHIAVNLSVSQLEAPDIFDKFAPIAHPVFLGSHRLAVEVPEEAVSQLTQPLFTTLARLSDMGIDLHLDHFGRSNLSLSALHSLPFSLLKLDISLVKNMSSEASGDVLIRTAIMLAHHLGMKAGAVGVEELWQTNALLAQSCDVMQGFLTMPPMTAEQFAGWVRKSAK